MDPFPCLFLEGGGPIEAEKENDPAGQTVNSRLGIPDPGYDSYCDYGVLAHGPGVYHVTADRIQRQHGMVRTDF